TYKSNFGTGTYRDIDVRSESLAYLALHGNNLQKSTDGGMTWANMTYPTVAAHFFSTYFINDNTGFATGQPVAGQPGYVLKTTDGANWTNTALGAAGQIFNRVVFVNSTTGFIVGNLDKIFTTTNTGGTWSEMASGTTNTLRNFDFSNNIRIAVGDGGAIMRLVDITTSNENLQENNLMQIYPNPVKDILHINVDVKKLTVRDITGKVVLLSETQQNINMAHLSKGIYLLQVQTADGIVEKKIMKE
ncbi:MAG: T9SS type A sorting domain-containing protein, partial [Paludibacter sp.]|nr:T9SS type A sorting domain-containing protein [Paludibacter sp.]